jgi:uncharacterized protein YjiS (DUF1127 family)
MSPDASRPDEANERDETPRRTQIERQFEPRRIVMTSRTDTDRVAPRLPSIATLALAALRWLATANDRARQRRALLELDDRMLADIGISRGEADAEAAKLHRWTR